MTNIPFKADSFFHFPTGRVNLEDIHAIFKTMPYELHYVNAADQYI